MGAFGASAAAAARSWSEVTGGQKIAACVLLAYLFFLFSRIFEIALPSVRALGILYGVTLLVALIAGAAQRALAHRIGFIFVGLLAWFTLSVPFSSWPGGSVSFLLDAFKCIPVFFLIAGILSSYSQFRSGIHTVAYAIVVLTVIAILAQAGVAERLTMAQGRFSNPNDLAQILIIGLPFWLFMAGNHNLTRLRRVLALPPIILVLFTMVKTGSRGGFIGLAAILLVLFIDSSGINRMKFILVAVLAIACALPFLPETVKARYLTLMQPDLPSETEVRDGTIDTEEEYSNARASVSAAASAQSRLRLAQQGLRLLIENPLLGVGPGMFVIAERDLAERDGQRAYWHDAHNSYVQIASECGLPALVMYVWLIASSLRRCRRLQKGFAFSTNPKLREISIAALGLKLSLVGYAVTCLFGAVAYSVFLPMLAGFVVVLERVAALESAKLSQLARSAQPAAATLTRSLVAPLRGFPPPAPITRAGV